MTCLIERKNNLFPSNRKKKHKLINGKVSDLTIKSSKYLIEIYVSES